MNDQLWIAILTSGGVGALVGAGITLVGQFLERRARRKELLLSKAIDLAFRRTDITLKLAEKYGRPAGICDDATLAADYFKELGNLLDKGNFSLDYKRHEVESIKAEKARVAKPHGQRSDHETNDN